MNEKSETSLTQQGVVLACVTDHPRAITLLRAAKRRAARLDVPWIAVYIDESESMRSQGVDIKRAMQNLTLAEQMGAKVVNETAPSFYEGILHQLETLDQAGREVQAIFIEEEEQDNWWDLFRQPVSERLRQIIPDNCRLEIIAYEGRIVNPLAWLEQMWLRDITLKEVMFALGTVVLATLAAALLKGLMPSALYRLNDSNISLIFMIACAASSGRYGLLPGLITAVVGFLSLNFFFIVPYFQVAINTPTQALNLGLFLMASVLMAFFVSRTHAQGERLQRQIYRMQALTKLYSASLTHHTRQPTLEALHTELTETLGTKVGFYLPQTFAPQKLHLAWPKKFQLSEEDEKALNVCWEEARVTGFGSPYHSNSKFRFIPLTTQRDVIGVMAVAMEQQPMLDVATGRLLSSTADLVALILDRIDMGQAMEESRVREEREKLRAMLLSSVSHDLKTPLASVIGSLSVYRSMGEQLPEEHRHTLINTAIEEAQRLDSFITNILDMTRIESGQIEFKQEWVRPHELLTRVQKRLKDRLSGRTITVNEPKQPVEILIDPIMSEQVVQNLLDNAAKYTPDGTAITIDMETGKKAFRLMVRDEGPGIPEDKLRTVFDKYARIRRQDSQVAGTGLGLAISKAVMEAQGGTAEVFNHPNGGAVFTLTWPRWRKAKNKEMVA